MLEEKPCTCCLDLDVTFFLLHKMKCKARLHYKCCSSFQYIYPTILYGNFRKNLYMQLVNFSIDSI